MRNLSLDQLKALETVAALRSFTAAARRLALSQPAVSTQVSELEQRLGLRLIERVGKKAVATAAGTEVIAHARRIAAEVEAAGIAMRRHREGFLGRVRVGALPAILNYILLPGIVPFQRAYPNIEVVLRTGTTPELVPLLAENELDLVLGALPVEHKAIDVQPLRMHPLLAVFPGATQGLPDAITPAEMMRHPLIVDGVSRNDALVHAWLREAGYEPRPVMEIGDTESIKCAVAAGLGMSVLPSFILRAEVVSGALITRPLDPAIRRTMVLLKHRDKRDDPALRVVYQGLLSLKRDMPGA
jgi:DNA-binding transcriptional LysR family regulator